MARTPQYAGMPNPNAIQKRGAELVPGDRIRVAQNDRGATLPVYTRRFNAVATVIRTYDDVNAVVPALAIETDLGTVRTTAAGLLTIAEDE